MEFRSQLESLTLQVLVYLFGVFTAALRAEHVQHCFDIDLFAFFPIEFKRCQEYYLTYTIAYNKKQLFFEKITLRHIFCMHCPTFYSYSLYQPCYVLLHHKTPVLQRPESRTRTLSSTPMRNMNDAECGKGVIIIGVVMKRHSNSSPQQKTTYRSTLDITTLAST